MPTFTYDIGYYGYATIAGKPILCTDGSISLQQTPIYTTGIWGAGWSNGGKNVCFAPDYPILTIQLGFQLTSSNDLFSQLGKFSSSQRNTKKKVVVFPNGVAGYSGDVYCQSISFQTSQDSLVTGSVTAKGPGFKTQLTSGSTSSDTKNQKITTMASGYRSVFPYWGTKMQFGSTSHDISGNVTTTFNGTKDLISWSINQSADIVFAKCCNVSSKQITSLDDLHADYAALGLVTADGSFSILGMSKFLDSEDARGFCYATTSGVKIKMLSVDSQKANLEMYGMQLTQQSANMQIGTSLIQCDYSFTVIADGKNSVIKFTKT